jgi:hypothetical protein
MRNAEKIESIEKAYFNLNADVKTAEDVENDQATVDADEYWYFMDKPEDLWEQYEAGELEEDPYYDDYLSNWYGNDPTYEALHATSLPAELGAYWEVLEN